MEVGGSRSEAALREAGFKSACPYLGAETGEKEWIDYGACLAEALVAVIAPEPEPDPDEITDEEALRIITGE